MSDWENCRTNPIIYTNNFLIPVDKNYMMYQRSNLMSDNNCVGLNGTVLQKLHGIFPVVVFFLINLNTGRVYVWLLIKSNESLTVVYHHDDTHVNNYGSYLSILISLSKKTRGE